VLGKSDSFLGVVAKTRSAHCSIKSKGVVDQAMLLKKATRKLNYFV